MDPLKDSITVPELKMLLHHILKNAYIKEGAMNWNGDSDPIGISNINWSSTDKEEYKNFIVTIADAVSILDEFA